MSDDTLLAITGTILQKNGARIGDIALTRMRDATMLPLVEQSVGTRAEAAAKRARVKSLFARKVFQIPFVFAVVFEDVGVRQ
jgi:hypothetical protein